MNQVTNAQLSAVHNPSERDRYKAQHITFRTANGNVFHFDSRWELDVFRLIRQCPIITEIHKDYRIEVLPQTPHFPSRKWRLDFRLVTASGHILNIECKSTSTAMHADFRRTLENISYFHPTEFERLLVVLPSGSRKDLPRLSKYLRIPVYPDGLMKSATLITGDDLGVFLRSFRFT